MSTSTLACSLTDQESRQRRTFVRKNLLAHILMAEKCGTGLQVSFPDTLSIRKNLDEFVALESHCCRFLSFDVVPIESGLMLRIAGPAGAHETLEMFAKGLGIQ